MAIRKPRNSETQSPTHLWMYEPWTVPGAISAAGPHHAWIYPYLHESIHALENAVRAAGWQWCRAHNEGDDALLKNLSAIVDEHNRYPAANTEIGQRVMLLVGPFVNAYNTDLLHLAEHGAAAGIHLAVCQRLHSIHHSPMAFRQHITGVWHLDPPPPNAAWLADAEHDDFQL